MVFFSSNLPASQAALAPVTNLSELSTTINSENRPLLLLFSAEHCEYCQRLTEEQLLPMLKNEATRDKVILREVKIDDIGYFLDFEGEKISYSDFADMYAVDITPTLVLLDHKGRLLSRRIIGYANPDFFSAYMDEHIKTAVRKLRRLKP